MMEPFYADDTVTLWHGDMREIVLQHHLRADLIVADPPYGETSLPWDRWPFGWLIVASKAANAMWCFGSMRVLANRWREFGEADWAFSQDVVWEKHNGSGFHADRFKRVHEHATHWYSGAWSDQYHETPTTDDATARQVRRKQRPTHMGDIERGSYVSEDGGPRLMRSVLAVRSMHGRAIHPTEKPVGLLDPLIRYACPPGGTVLDPFAGSGSTAAAARLSGRRAILVEARRAVLRGDRNTTAAATPATRGGVVVMVRKPPRPGGQRRDRGMCPICARNVALLRDGTVATRHLDQATRARCKGCGEKALPLPEGDAS